MMTRIFRCCLVAVGMVLPAMCVQGGTARSVVALEMEELRLPGVHCPACPLVPMLY